MNQLETIHIVTAAGAARQKRRARRSAHMKNESSSGNVLSGMPALDPASQWSQKVKDKKQLFGPHMRIAVGGQTDGEHISSKDEDWEPVFWHCSPPSLLEEVMRSEAWADGVLDYTPTDVAAKKAMDLGIPYVGVVYSETHKELLLRRLASLIVKDMLTEGHSLFNAEAGKLMQVPGLQAAKATVKPPAPKKAAGGPANPPAGADGAAKAAQPAPAPKAAVAKAAAGDAGPGKRPAQGPVLKHRSDPPFRHITYRALFPVQGGCCTTEGPAITLSKWGPILSNSRNERYEDTRNLSKPGPNKLWESARAHSCQQKAYKKPGSARARARSSVFFANLAGSVRFSMENCQFRRELSIFHRKRTIPAGIRKSTPQDRQPITIHEWPPLSGEAGAGTSSAHQALKARLDALKNQATSA